MKKILLILIYLPVIGFGQGWEQTFGGSDADHGYSVQQTLDEGYIIVGQVHSFGNIGGDVYLIKTDGNGNEQWTNTFGGTESDLGSSIQQTTDDGYIITGRTNSFDNGVLSDVYLIKTDENGNEQWTNTFGGTESDRGQSVKQVSDGGYIITGITNSFGNGGPDVYLIKTDENGNEQWTKTFGGTVSEYGLSVQQTTDQGYIITGWTTSFGNANLEGQLPYADVYLIKTDENGNEQWTKTFGGVESDYSSCVKQTIDEGYIITGTTQSFGYGGSDAYLIKTDGNGNEQWTKTFGGTGDDTGNSVQQTNDGGYILTGWIEYENDIDVWLIKTNESGDEQWTKTFGGTEDDYSFSVQQTNDNGYIIVGETYSFGNEDGNIYLIKTDSEGNITSTFEIPLPNPNRKLDKTIDILGKETKPQPNTPIIEIYDDGTVEKKVIIE